MRKLAVVISLSTPLLLAGCVTGEQASQWFNIGASTARSLGYNNPANMADGIKQALELGSERAGASLSAQNGYALAGYPITLPKEVQPVADTLRKVGMGSYVDKLETAMQRGAEQAAAESVPVFKQAISNMTVSDALGIIQGNDTAATDYFRGQTEATLRAKYQPIIQSNLQKTGFYDQYKSMLSVYDALPLTSKPNLDLESIVLDQSLNALFGRVAEEEKLIRADPVGRGSALIGSVFGGQNGQ